MYIMSKQDFKRFAEFLNKYFVYVETFFVIGMFFFAGHLHGRAYQARQDEALINEWVLDMYFDGEIPQGKGIILPFNFGKFDNVTLGFINESEVNKSM